MKQAFRLSQAVLASTLFIVPSISYADLVLDGDISAANVVYATATPPVNGNLQITNTGFIDTNNLGVNNGDGILANKQNAFIALDPNNSTFNNGISAVRNGITITGGPNTSVTVGSGTTKIAADGIGIFADSATSTVTNSGTIQGKGVASTGIVASANGANFALINQSTGNVVSLGTALALNGAAGAVDNFGTIAGIGGITVGGQNVLILNESGATISGTSTSAVAVNATGLTLANAGNITGTLAGGNGIQLNQNFSSVTNTSTGKITSAFSDGIVTNGAITGSIQNNGLITSNGIGAGGVRIAGDLTGSVTNTGTISNTNGAVASDGIITQGAFTAINNSGTISAVGAGNAIAVLAGSKAGTITNSSLIQSQNAAAILLSADITQISNTGTISTTAAAPAAILANASPVTLTGGIVNSGTISNGGGVATPAIDLQAGGNAINVKLTQNGGTIGGKVLLASAGGAIFDMNGGTITGDVQTSNVANSTLNLNSGTIAGNLTLQSALGNTVNMAGTTLNTITSGAGVDTFNLTGGTFTTLTGGAGDILNVKASYSTTGDILTVPTVNVTAGNFTVNNKLTGFTNLNVGPNASMTVNSNTVTGAAAAVVVGANSTLSVTSGNQLNTGAGDITLLNGGALSLANSAVQTGALTNSFNSNAGGIYRMTIEGPGNFGKMQVGAGGATLAANSYVAPQLGSGTFIPGGTTFDVITGGPVNDASTLVQPGSLTVTFAKSTVGGNILRLTAQRSGFAPYANTDGAQGVAGALDNIALQGTTNPQLLAVLGQLDLIGNQAQLIEELESLAPPVNYSLVAATHVSMDQMFRSIRRRIEDMRYLRTLGSESYQIVGPDNMIDRNSGYNYGDSVYSEASHGGWVQGYGSILDQRRRHEVDGYLGDAAGVAFGMDWGRQGALVGGAINFTQVHMVGQTEDENVQNLQSVQGTVYSWIDLTNDIYIDTQFGFSSHHYKTRRNIGIGTITTAAFADFFGVHFGAQTEIGYAFLYDNLSVAPLVRLRYTRLSIDDYSENGAGGLNLTVQNQGMNEGIAGVGLRVVGKKEFAQAVYAPEASFMLAYDFYGDGQATSSRFLGGGPLFPTIGIKPAQTMMLFDLGVNVHTYDSYIFTVKGELDLRDHFYGYSGWVNLYRSW